ncbi:uncharacterized protein LOC131669898 [Phymastichus coffea]|uniref:uncharacterized protein LOC131669898 n=1 Tax=Phymastichus coffea TaxID=108790 RepID=UPI00273B1C97|nr:uncharacterized protein LOC131669898 [Phymastichus coffea]
MCLIAPSYQYQATSMFASFAILLISLHIGNAEYKNTEHFPNKTLVLSELSFSNDELYYALCDQPPKQCTIVHATNNFFNPKTCVVNLEADEVQLIVTFDQDKAILVALESTSKSAILKTITVNVLSCKTVDQELFEIPSNWTGLQLYRKNIDLVVFDDGFEIIVKGLSRICSKSEEDKYCGFNFESEGKLIEGPYIWPRADYNHIDVISPILTDASGKGYFYVNKNYKQTNILLIGIQANRIGGPTYTKLWGPQNISSEPPRGGLSTANNFNGACYGFNSAIKCWQNNAEGELQMSTKFSFKLEHEIWNLSVHNLPNGGFLVLMITCPNRICAGVNDHYYLIKIDAQGKKVDCVEIDLKNNECNAENGIISAITFLEGRSYCWIRLCHVNKHEGATLELSANCYSDYDFLNQY